MFFLSALVLSNTDGSLQVRASQRFFDSSRLGEANGFSEWGAYQFEIHLGLTELMPRLEPTLQFSYVRNETDIRATNADGETVATLDRFSFDGVSGGAGLQYRFWPRSTFFISPWVAALLSYRFLWFRKTTAQQNPPTPGTTSRGGEIVPSLSAGAFVSFLWSDDRAQKMISEYGVKDFGLILSSQWMPVGFLKSGNASLVSTTGWDFGASLLIDW